MTAGIGNLQGLPTHEDYLETLGFKPTGLRVYQYPYDREERWQLDGYAVVFGAFAYTERLWEFRTVEEAWAALPEFAKEVGLV